ncbi:MAG: carbohydrate ABC transporter permease [Anaerolineales bacterium]
MAAKSFRSTNPVMRWIALAALAIILLLMLMPFILVTINAIKTEPEFARFGPLSLPHGINLTSLESFWVRADFSRALFNSTFISLSVAVLAVILSLLNAFAMGFGKVKGRAWLLVFFLMANFLPQEALAYPLYYFAKFLNIYDTPVAVILVLTVIQSAFGTYLLSSVFSSFPREILEAAMMDGSNKMSLLLDIVAPLSLPTLSVLFVFFFIWTWNEFFLPLILLPSNANMTVPLALAINQGQYGVNITGQSASGLLGILPCIIFFLIFQRTLTKGITAGGIK